MVRMIVNILFFSKYADIKGSYLYDIGSDREEITKLLIKYGADINAVDNYGNTPLILAALKGTFHLNIHTNCRSL